MKKIALLLGIVLSLSIFDGTAFAEQRRVNWDMSRLPILKTSETRALFGFEALTSINDDYSWTTNLPGTNYWQSVLMPCEQISKIDLNYSACIEKVSYRKIGSNSWIDGFLSTVQLGEPTTTIAKGGDANLAKVGKLALDIDSLRPEGFKATLWTFSKASHASGMDYLLRTRFIGDTASPTEKNFYLELVPVAYPGGSTSPTQDQIRIEEFPNDMEFRVRLKLGIYIKTLTGWFFGRMQSPTIDRNGPAGYLEVTGSPARVPIGLTDVVPVDQADKYFDPVWCAELSQARNKPCGSINKLWDKAVTYTVAEKSAPIELNRWEAAPGGVKTVATNSEWKISSAFFWDVKNNSSNSLQCASKLYGADARVFLGAVFSNSSLFQTQPPQWDSTSESFSFQVASPHLDEKGVPNKGSYTLYIPLELAQCLWGNSTAEPKANVAIINSDGVVNVTTAVTKVENGNLRFNISGFTYSSPTIKISLTKSLAKPSKITITCIKGKTTKKLSGMKPSCPKGFTQKTL